MAIPSPSSPLPGALKGMPAHQETTKHREPDSKSFLVSFPWRIILLPPASSKRIAVTSTPQLSLVA
jgi:hypothetical protein